MSRKNTPEVERAKARKAILTTLGFGPQTGNELASYAWGLPGRLRRKGALAGVLAELVAEGLVRPTDVPCVTPVHPETRPGFALVERTDPLPFEGGNR